MCSVELSPMNNKNGHGKRRSKEKNRNHPRRKKKQHTTSEFIFVKNAVISSNQQASMRSTGKILIRYQIKCSRDYGTAKTSPTISHFRFLSVWSKREKITPHLNGILGVVRWFCVDGVFAIINHWLLHQAVKRLNKTKAICFAVTYVPLCCAMLFFFLLFFFLMCDSAFFLPVQGISTHETTSSLSCEIYDQCNPNHMCIISSQLNLSSFID